MITERDPMTLNESSVPALGGEERSDEAPRAGRARPTPDPEVVAKPKRRQFTAQYRLRILEEAERCAQPGEVGRLLRREGLYSSHLTAWRKARRKGSLRELAPKKRGAKPGERNPLDAKVRALEAKVARLEHELHTAHTILDVQGKVAGLLGLNLEHGARSDGSPTASDGRRRAKRWGCRGQPSTVVETPGPSPVQRPPGRCANPNASMCSTCSPPLASSIARPPRSPPRCSMKANTCARSARCIGSWPRISRSESGAINVHPQYTKPELPRGRTKPGRDAVGAEEVDVLYLYVVLDIFSRYAVGWMVADRENSALAGRLIEQTCHKQGVQPQVLTLHSDRGAPMTSKCTAQLLADLGITRSLSRPQVSDDNPFSEAQFKTLKYHPGFPGRFDDIHAAIAFCRSFFPWYNTEHRHGGIAMLTPDDVHHGRAHTVLQQREQTLRDAWDHHPERFVRGIPKPLPIPEAVWINPPATSTSTTGETAQ